MRERLNVKGYTATVNAPEKQCMAAIITANAAAVKQQQHGVTMSNQTTFLTAEALEQSQASSVSSVHDKLDFLLNGRNTDDMNNDTKDDHTKDKMMSSPPLSPYAPSLPKRVSQNNLSVRSKNFSMKLRQKEKKFHHKQNKRRVETYSCHTWYVATLSKVHDYRKRNNSKDIPSGILSYIHHHICLSIHTYML